jgi:hypothetical protein
MTLTCDKYEWDKHEEEKHNRRRKRIKLVDRRGGPSTYYGENSNGREFITIVVDGGVIRKGTAESRCDYLLLDVERKFARLIELKGSDYGDGYRQLADSYKKFKSTLIKNGYRKIEGRLVCTSISVPNHHNTPEHKKIAEDIFKECKLFIRCVGGARMFEDLDTGIIRK